MSNNFTNSSLSEEFLQSKRKLTDPIADKVISTIISSGYEDEVNQVFRKLVSNESYTPSLFEDLPKEVFNAVTSYFEETSTLPEWADQTLIAKGQQVFALYGPEISMLLNVKALPLCYTCGNGAKVLYMTGRLSAHGSNIDPLARRLMETAQMVMNTMIPEGLSEQGNGIITIQKVRLIHASIRYFLKNEKFNKAGWDAKKYGEPINQEDMAGTLMSFSALMIKGLEQLSITLSESEKLGYMHAWRVIGHLMGLDEDLLPHNFEEGWALGVSIMKHQAEETEDGKELTKSCIKFMQYITPGNFFDDIPEYMIWFFTQDVSEATGKDLAKCIGVTESAGIKGKVAIMISRFIGNQIDNAEDHSFLIRTLSKRFNRILLQGFLQHYNGGKNVHFYIPPNLQKDWQLSENWIDKFAITPNIFGNRLMWQQKQ